MRNKRILSFAAVAFLIPLTLYLGSRMSGRWHYLTSTLIILEMMVPFFFLFEARKPQARELVTIAVLCALAAVSRVTFPFLPNFKPITAVVMIAGIALGPESGFLTGAVSAFASNFFLSQGPWTPWQMLAYGMGGFVAGLAFAKHPKWRNPLILASFGFGTVMVLVGPILDCCTLFTSVARITWKTAVLVFTQGIFMNLSHATATAVTLALFGPALLEKLDRLKRKYGMLQ